MKKLLIICSGLILSACGVQNNITYTTQMGQCPDSVTGAPYCMGVTIQNNSGGQNWITNTNFAINQLSLSVTGATNVGYPSSQGSSYDPSNCLGSTISPGGKCTFYLWLTGESVPVGKHLPIQINATYNVNTNLFGGGGSSYSSSTTVYQTPALMLSTPNSGSVESYSYFGLSLPYRAESENIANANANDNYYGFLYLAGNNGIYLSNESGFIANATKSSSTIRGASNLVFNGTTLFGTPYNVSTLPNVYRAGIIQESFVWTSYATGLNPVRNNISAKNGVALYFAQSNTPSVTLCNPTASSGSGCANEAQAIPGSSVINALGYIQLGIATNGSILTGLVAGTDNGLWAESGISNSTANQWIQFNISGDTRTLGSNIVSIVTDKSSNVYVADDTGRIFIIAPNAGNTATQMSNWDSLVGLSIVTMVYDNAAQAMFVGMANGDIYECYKTMLSPACGSAPVIYGSKSGMSQLLGLNIVTSLTNY